MKFPRPKKVLFCNNKGGVGKTTLSFQVAVNLAKKGYKVALIDLDPQCNLTLQTLGYTFYEDNLFTPARAKTVYDLLKPKIEGSGDIDLSVPLHHVRDNIYILPGDIQLSVFESILMTSAGEAAAGLLRGYSDTSAIDRYLSKVGAAEGIDIFIIDTSPSLGVLNRFIFLGAEYFVVPLTPDSYSLQGIGNLGKVFEGWKKNWQITAKAAAVAGDTPNSHVLQGDALFIGYIVNEFNRYDHKVIKRQQEWVDKINNQVKESLSEKHGRNGLVEKSWKNPLGNTQDYGQLTSISMKNNLGFEEFDIEAMAEIKAGGGTAQLHEKAVEEIGKLTDNIINILQKY